MQKHSREFLPWPGTKRTRKGAAQGGSRTRGKSCFFFFEKVSVLGPVIREAAGLPTAGDDTFVSRTRVNDGSSSAWHGM